MCLYFVFYKPVIIGSLLKSTLTLLNNNETQITNSIRRINAADTTRICFILYLRLLHKRDFCRRNRYQFW